MSELQNPDFWRGIEERLRRVDELGLRAAELRRQNEAQLEQIQRDMDCDDRPPMRISWHTFRQGLATATSGTAAMLLANTLAPFFGTRRLLR